MYPLNIRCLARDETHERCMTPDIAVNASAPNLVSAGKHSFRHHIVIKPGLARLGMKLDAMPSEDTSVSLWLRGRRDGIRSGSDDNQGFEPGLSSMQLGGSVTCRLQNRKPTSWRLLQARQVAVT